MKPFLETFATEESLVWKRTVFPVLFSFFPFTFTFSLTFFLDFTTTVFFFIFNFVGLPYFPSFVVLNTGRDFERITRFPSIILYAVT